MAGPRYLRSDDESFFRPLSELDLGDTRVYLGIVLSAGSEAARGRRR
jgi:hypothetical protein